MTNATVKQVLEPVVTRAGADRAPHPIQLPGHDIVLKLSRQDTGDTFAVGILRAQPMSGPPLHVHTREDEWFFVLQGELTFQVGAERFTAGPGTSVFAPRDVPHTWQNFTTGLVEALGIVTPPQLEEYFLEASRGPFDPAVMEQLNRRFGISVLGPPLAR